MIHPKPLTMQNKSNKQIIDGLTARNLEMHIINLKIIKENEEKDKEIAYLKTKSNFLQETLLKDATAERIIDEQHREKP